MNELIFHYDIPVRLLIEANCKPIGVLWGQSYLRGEGASLALAGHPSSDGVTIKIPYGVDDLHHPSLHPIFSYWVG